jgi:hypothetical protein
LIPGKHKAKFQKVLNKSRTSMKLTIHPQDFHST